METVDICFLQVNAESLATVTTDNMVQLSDLSLLQQNPQVVSTGPGPVPETVTVTLTQSPGEGKIFNILFLMLF